MDLEFFSFLGGARAGGGGGDGPHENHVSREARIHAPDPDNVDSKLRRHQQFGDLRKSGVFRKILSFKIGLKPSKSFTGSMQFTCMLFLTKVGVFITSIAIQFIIYLINLDSKVQNKGLFLPSIIILNIDILILFKILILDKFKAGL